MQTLTERTHTQTHTAVILKGGARVFGVAASGIETRAVNNDWPINNGSRNDFSGLDSNRTLAKSFSKWSRTRFAMLEVGGTADFSTHANRRVCHSVKHRL